MSPANISQALSQLEELSSWATGPWKIRNCYCFDPQCFGVVYHATILTHTPCLGSYSLLGHSNAGSKEKPSLLYLIPGTVEVYNISFLVSCSIMLDKMYTDVDPSLSMLCLTGERTQTPRPNGSFLSSLHSSCKAVLHSAFPTPGHITSNCFS